MSIISYGSVSRGSIYALQGRGFNNIHVFSRRPPHLVADQNPDVYFYHLIKSNGRYMVVPTFDSPRYFFDELKESDIIVNGILQDPVNPETFISNSDLDLLKKNAIIIDISCDAGMGFEFAVPTTFEKPLLFLRNGIKYYSVDHVPSYLWNAATREISKALTPYIVELVKHSFDFHCNRTLSKAIEIENGLIRNPQIIAFQKRENQYPYRIKS